MKTQRAFTIIELMITVAIAAILITVAVPAMQDMVRNNRLVTQTNLLVSHIQLARSEAIKRSAPAVLCRSANPRAASPSCGGTANIWTSGWLVFADVSMAAAPGCELSPDGNGVYDPNLNEIPNNGVDDDGNGCVDDTDVLIRVGEPAAGDIDIHTSANANANLRYRANGTLNETGAACFAVCDGRPNPENFGRRIRIQLTGRPALTPGTVLAPLVPATSCDEPAPCP